MLTRASQADLPLEAIAHPQAQVACALASEDNTLAIEANRHPHRIGSFHGDRQLDAEIGRLARDAAADFHRFDQRPRRLRPLSARVRKGYGLQKAIALDQNQVRALDPSPQLFQILRAVQNDEPGRPAFVLASVSGSCCGARRRRRNAAARRRLCGSWTSLPGRLAGLRQQETTQPNEQVRQKVQCAAPSRVA